MRILIAGASGYIGGRLSTYLAEQGHQIIALCNSSVPIDSTWIALMEEVIKVDVSSHVEVEKLVKYNIDVIINLVSLDHHQSNGNPNIVSSVNVEPTWSFLQVFAERNLKKYIYLSTIHVYGNQLLGEIVETSPVNPATAYGLTHLMSEQVCNYFASNKGVECYNIRFSNGFGAPKFAGNKCWDLVINNLCLNVWQNQQLILKSDGSPVRDFINITDLLIGINALLNKSDNQKGTKAETINFSSGQTISMLEAAFVVKKVYEGKYGKKADIFINEQELVGTLPNRPATNSYQISNKKFKYLNEGRLLHSIEFGINELFDFLDQQYG